MKKLLLSLVAVAGLVYSANAQTEKGKVMLGGSIGFNSTKVEGAAKSDVSFSVVPSVGYFVDNNFAIGTGVGYNYNKQVSENTLNQAFVVAPFGRYYVGLSEQFKFFGQLSVPMSFGNTKRGDVNGDNFTKVSKDNNVGVALSPGFAFFPSKKFGIEFSVNGISYNDYNAKDANGNDNGGSKNFNIGANFFAPKIGVQFYL